MTNKYLFIVPSSLYFFDNDLIENNIAKQKITYMQLKMLT